MKAGRAQGGSERPQEKLRETGRAQGDRKGLRRQGGPMETGRAQGDREDPRRQGKTMKGRESPEKH